MYVYHLKEHEFNLVEQDQLPALLARGEPIWIDMVGPTAEGMRVMAEVFKFHPLAIEDTRNQRQRPRVDDYGDYLFTILNPIQLEGDEVCFREFDVFIGRHYLVTVHGAEEPLIESVINRCRVRLGQNAVLTIGYVLYVLSDVIVDEYLPVMDAIEDEIDTLSELILTGPRQSQLERMFQLKRSLSEISRVVSQQRDMFGLLMRDDSDYIQQANLRYYMRDVLDHLIRTGDTAHTLRDTLDGLVNLYLSSASNQLNMTISRLTILTLVFGAFAVITGFYGMNFERTWPSFDSAWGVPFVLMLMLITFIIVFVYTRARLSRSR